MLNHIKNKPSKKKWISRYEIDLTKMPMTY